MNKPTIKLFLSYAHDDEGDTKDVTEFLKDLNKCFKASKHFHYELWADRDLLVGEAWHGKITGSLEQCDYGLMLVSLSFITSDYIGKYELPELLNSGRALPIGFQKIDLNWFDSQGISAQQVFYHKDKFYGELGSKTQDRSEFTQALVREIETKFLAKNRLNQDAEKYPVEQQKADTRTISTTQPAVSNSVDEGATPANNTGIFNTNNLFLVGGLLLLMGGLIYSVLSLFGPLPTDEPVILENNIGLQPVLAGQFEMGGQSSHTNERPVHTVDIKKPFWISATEITFAQYSAYTQAQRLAIPTDDGWGRDQRPVINISWHEAKAYAAWLGETNGKGLDCRLPSEAEWEYAARGGSRMTYAWGEKPGKNNAHCTGCGSPWEGKRQSVPVASFPANDFGLYDMHGNVAEWVEDSWHADYRGAPIDGSVWQSGANEERRVIRGGSWGDKPDAIHSAHRARTEPGSKNNYVGFRVVCEFPDD